MTSGGTEHQDRVPQDRVAVPIVCDQEPAGGDASHPGSRYRKGGGAAQIEKALPGFVSPVRDSVADALEQVKIASPREWCCSEAVTCAQKLVRPRKNRGIV